MILLNKMTIQIRYLLNSHLNNINNQLNHQHKNKLMYLLMVILQTKDFQNSYLLCTYNQLNHQYNCYILKQILLYNLSFYMLYYY